MLNLITRALGAGRTLYLRRYGTRIPAFDGTVAVSNALRPLPADEVEMEQVHARDFLDQSLRVGVIVMGLNHHGLLARGRVDAVVTLARRGEVPEVTTSGAVVQLQHGSRRDDTQAAHLVPRNIMVNGQNLWDFVPRDNPFLRNAVTGVLGRTNLLPSRVNRLDSLLERTGLVAVYQAYVQALVSIPRTPTVDAWVAYQCFRTFHNGVLLQYWKTRAELMSAVRRGGGDATRKALQLMQLEARLPVLLVYEPDHDHLRVLFEMFTSELPAPSRTLLLT